MECQIIVNKKNIRIITTDSIYKAILAVLIGERKFLMDQVKVDVVYADIHPIVAETPFHVTAEVTALLPHVIIGMQHQNRMIRFLPVSRIHSA